MSKTDRPDSDSAADPTLDTAAESDTQDVDAESPEKLDLVIKVDKRGTCERHITVTVARENIKTYYDTEFSELVTTSAVPGFRAGHAPRKLIETRFRKEIADKVKSTIVLDAISQVNDDEDLSAISEPDFDLDVVNLPDEGPMTFEYDLEVRPEFDLPQWKGMTIEKPVHEFQKEDIDSQLESILSRYGRLVPHDGAAEMGNYLTVNLKFTHNDQVLSSAEEEVIRLRSVLSFRDGKIEDFGKIMKGVAAGETRTSEAELSQDAPNVALRGEKITATFEVLDVKELELPELDGDFLESMGDFESEADLRDAVKDQLERQLEYEQHRRAREQVTSALTASADWDLPKEMLQRQSRRELDRAVMELQRSGFSEDDIQAHENTIRQNSLASTERALKEHFILERIADAEDTEVDESDYDAEIQLIAEQSNESVRRVRARLDKGGMMDALHNQIIERKVIDLILAVAEFKEVPFKPEATDSEAIDQSAGGHDESDIPEAKPESSEEAGSSEGSDSTDGDTDNKESDSDE
ncbi:MAG: trigger factor [Planctomycetota bacterium]|nr:trigger factor [Planctomycetota bacterium]